MSATLTLARPRPPRALREAVASGLFVPAPDVAEWLRETFIETSPEHAPSPLLDDYHEHLKLANIGVLWTNVELTKGMKFIAGTASVPVAQGDKWAKERHDLQLRDWFGEVPDFLITLFAPYADECEDINWCALVKHELCHCAQKKDKYGAPAITKEGMPRFGIQSHDVEEFVPVMRDFGVDACAGESRAFVAAAARAPRIAAASIASVCGTCAR